ncbi:MAG TPA: PKD domain-containing protein, partial [Saprospiraceae bacterium]|nr:PKD domain-containing protein [Saprospiraceae bacterium]
TYSWRDAAGTELSTSATTTLNPGIYAVHVQDAYGCPGVKEFTVNENPAPNVSISTADPTGFCNNGSFVTLTALANADGNFTYQWFQDGAPVGGNTPTFTTNQYGNFTVQVTNADGCTATAGPIVTFNYCGGGGGGGGLPGAGFPLCPPGSVDFTANATAVCDSFDFQLIPGPQYLSGSAQWTFGVSGSGIVGTASVENPGFNFPNAGKYLAILRVTLTDGSVCVVIDSVKVAAAAQFSAVTDCAGQATTFQDAGTFLPGNSITDWDWVFGDPPSGAGNVSDIRNPAHSYTTSGNPVVTLTITANTGCTATTSQALVIPGAAPATFALPAQNCAGNALEFIANLTPEMTQVVWNFGDLSSGAANDATGSPAYHSFTAPGNYAVNTTSSNAYGCTATETQIISIVPNGLSGNITPASPAPICEGTTITLTAPPGAVSYFWSDSTTTTQVFTTDEEGSYSVTLTDANGCTYSPPPVNVEITPGPDALIKALLENALGQIIGTSYPSLATCEGEDVHLIAQGNGVYNYSWSGGNGFDNELFFTDDRNNLLPVGIHTYTVTVTDVVTGCTSATEPFTVTVNPNPGGFSIASSGGCAGIANVLTYSGPQPANWQFIWNNGAPGANLTTEEPGLYYIRVINEFGCEAKSNAVVILPGPNVAAIPGGCHSRCRPDTLCLPNIPNIVSWQWYFNGNPVPGANGPDFVATQSGSYFAELTDAFGCTNQSDPLTLNLFDGFGNIDGQVWADVNKNGVVDAGDTLVSGIAVNLLENGNPVGSEQSAANGGFAFSNILSTNYIVEVDATLLPSDWSIVIGQDPVALAGCDAQEESDLLIKYCPPTGSDLLVNVCPGEVYDYNGTLLSAGQSQDFIYPNFQGCDSIVTVNVFGVNASASSFAVSICPNETYDYYGTLLTAGQTQDFHFQNLLGCDSTVTVTVNALPVSTNTLNASVCPGTLYDYNGTQLAAGQSQNFVFQNYLGCDSTVTVTVSALPVSSAVLNVSVCPGTLYDYNGTQLAAGQSQNFVFQNYLGCDSTVTVTVGQSPTEYLIVDALACEGDSVQFYGVWIPVNSSHVFTFQNSSGCDSIIEIAVGSFGPPEFSTLTTVVCPGETFAYNGLQLAPGTTTDVVLANIWGCDSTVSVTVTAYSVPAEQIEAEVCPGTTYNYNGTELAAGTTQEFHFTTPEGCDSTVTVVVTGLPEATFGVSPESSCIPSPTGSLTVTGAAGGLPPYRYSLDGTAFQDDVLFDQLAAGDYTVYLEDSNGCIFDENTEIPALPRLEVGLTDGVLPCDNSGTRLEVATNDFLKNLTFKWFNGDTTFFTFVDEAGPVWVDVTNHCETVRGEANVYWEDIPTSASYAYVPNVIKPASNDPDNSEFKPFFQPNLTILEYRFEVFDRWGNKLFGTEQPDQGWQGAFRAEDMNPGVYVWYVKVKFAFCGIEKDLLLSGDVTVVR